MPRTDFEKIRDLSGYTGSRTLPRGGAAAMLGGASTREIRGELMTIDNRPPANPGVWVVRFNDKGGFVGAEFFQHGADALQEYLTNG